MTRNSIKTIVSRAPVFDSDKCIVCGCTDSRACAEGCSWSVNAPPVCSSCVTRWLIANLWDIAMRTRKLEARPVARSPIEIEDLRRIYTALSKQETRHGLPAFRQVRQIGRNEMRWTARHTSAKKGGRT